jgi:hypothetical protein
MLQRDGMKHKSVANVDSYRLPLWAQLTHMVENNRYAALCSCFCVLRFACCFAVVFAFLAFAYFCVASASAPALLLLSNQ